MLPKLRSLLNPSSTSLQILSDLHLEINQQYSSFDIPPTSKHLILAGDVGRLADYDEYLAFLQNQTDKFETVFLVLGNHEFYNASYAAGLERARQLGREPCLKGRLVLLHRRRYDIPDSKVTVLGCTLWSNVPIQSKDIVVSKVKDFQRIHDWTVNEHNTAHESDLTWLRSEMQSIRQEQTDSRGKGRSIVVVTHHAPSLTGTSNPAHEGSPWSCAFGTELLDGGGWEGVKTWVFGHTHYTADFWRGGVRVVSNQRGYVLPWSEKETGFDAGRVIWV